MDSKQKVLIYNSAEERFEEVAAASVDESSVVMHLEEPSPGEVLKKSQQDMHRANLDMFRRQKKIPVIVVLDNIRSLNNIGSIFRTCDGFACAGIRLCGITATPPSPEIHKTALGAEESVEWQYCATTREAVDTLRAEGYRIVCLEQVHGSIALQNFKPSPSEKYALIAGNEVDGVDPAIVAGADIYLEIPQSGTKHSLNVAVATAVTLWQFYSNSDIVAKV